MPIESPEHPGWIVARLARQLELAVSTVDLTLPQYRLLTLLGAGREAASALADKLAVSRPSVTGVVDGLVARGLVARNHESGDRRRVEHDLTDQGRRVLAAADAEVERRLGEIAAQRPERAPAAYKGLGAWGDALNAHRAARRARAATTAQTTAATTAQTTAATTAAPR